MSRATKDSVTVGSNGLVRAPGFIPWLKNVYVSDPAKAFEILANSIPDAPVGLFRDYFEGDAVGIVGPDGDTFLITRGED